MLFVTSDDVGKKMQTWKSNVDLDLRLTSKGHNIFSLPARSYNIIMGAIQSSPTISIPTNSTTKLSWAASSDPRSPLPNNRKSSVVVARPRSEVRDPMPSPPVKEI